MFRDAIEMDRKSHFFVQNYHVRMRFKDPAASHPLSTVRQVVVTKVTVLANNKYVALKTFATDISSIHLRLNRVDLPSAPTRLCISRDSIVPSGFSVTFAKNPNLQIVFSRYRASARKYFSSMTSHQTGKKTQIKTSFLFHGVSLSYWLCAM